MLPKRREKGLLTERLPDETIVYDTTTHKVHCLTPVATLVWQRCDGNTSKAELAEILRQELGVRANDPLVQLTLEQLAEKGLLEQPAQLKGRTSRREVARLLAKCGIAAAALVVTVAAPGPAQAATSCPSSQLGTCANNRCVRRTNGQMATCFVSSGVCQCPP